MAAVTKEEAARMLFDGALRACRDGDFVCALTLAGAAEGAVPPAPNSLSFLIRDLVSIFGTKTEKSAADELNTERNWLKHYNLSEVSKIDISAKTAQVLMARAWNYFAVAYGDSKAREYWPNFFAILHTRDK